ncbi:hypothetical protein [Parasaccharibacter sp. TMW 2.1888]|uniref:hypothetical protein n=1 Tax=Parasaccharibacter sp. TMW 2.1888 TaxID=2268025 RepID=UPI0020BEF5CA|nr:hypothetical protein [Parasaccharibacter sp. TMW 2.1888]
MFLPVRKNGASLWAGLLLVGTSVLAVISRLSVWQKLFGPSLWLEMLRAGSQAGVVGGLQTGLPLRPCSGILLGFPYRIRPSCHRERPSWGMRWAVSWLSIS